jgi:hypothetical protein
LDQNLCDDCNHVEKDSNEKPCNSCLQWVDGYLTATNYENRHLKQFERKEREA